jgi:hypothetical protein
VQQAILTSADAVADMAGYARASMDCAARYGGEHGGISLPDAWSAIPR